MNGWEDKELCSACRLGTDANTAKQTDESKVCRLAEEQSHGSLHYAFESLTQRQTCFDSLECRWQDHALGCQIACLSLAMADV